MRDSITRSAAVVQLASGAWSGRTLAGPGPEQLTTGASLRADGLAAWQQIYSVLTHPCCINCHTATNYPQQGDDRHRHLCGARRLPTASTRSAPGQRDANGADWYAAYMVAEQSDKELPS
jgi:hypothetical protein